MCGVPYTALPIATVISTESNVPMLIKRKEAKSYGTKKVVEGAFKQGDTPIIVEDIITSGTSVLETIQELKKEGLNVTTALVIVDREQGGKKNLEEAGIKVLNLYTITELIGYLHEAGKLNAESVKIVHDYIKSVKAPIKLKNDDNRLKLHFDARAKHADNKAAKQLLQLMSQKQTTLCLAADLTKSQDILDLVEVAGPHIAVLKVHVDIIEDFTTTLIKKIKDAAKKYNFFIMEDRKFADIGQVVSNQVRKGIYNIAEWADFMTVHSVPGSGIIDGVKKGLEGISDNKGIFIVAEMSSKGALTTGDYISSTISNFTDSDLIAGYVCQKNIFTNVGCVQLTPGVQLTKSTDDLGQQYNTPQDVVNSGGDLIVVGRGITKAENKLSAVLEYKRVLWEAYQNRIK